MVKYRSGYKKSYGMKKYGGYKKTYRPYKSYGGYKKTYKKKLGRNKTRLVTSNKKTVSKVQVNLGHIHQKTSVVLLNTKHMLPSEVGNLDLEEDHLSIYREIAIDHPSNIFKRQAKDYGLDPSIIDPQIKVLSTKLEYSGVGDTNPGIFSFYSPINCSLSSMEDLSKILCLSSNNNIINELAKDIDAGITLCYVEKTGDKFAPITFSLSSVSGDQVLNAGVELDEPRIKIITSFVKTHKRKIIEAWLLGTLKFSKNANVGKVIAFGSAFNAVPFLVFDIPIYEYGSDVEFINEVDKAVLPKVNELGGTVQLRSNQYLGAITVFNRRVKYNKCLKAFALCNEEITRRLISLMATMIFRGFTMKGENTIIGNYLQLLGEAKFPKADLVDLDWLINAKVVSYRVFDYSDSKSVVYKPQNETNLHFIYVPEGIVCKIVMKVLRDYSGFMALFKNIIKSSQLKFELDSNGIELYKKLAPEYNLTVDFD